MGARAPTNVSNGVAMPSGHYMTPLTQRQVSLAPTTGVLALAPSILSTAGAIVFARVRTMRRLASSDISGPFELKESRRCLRSAPCAVVSRMLLQHQPHHRLVLRSARKVERHSSECGPWYGQLESSSAT